ncbi:MAG: glycosyltransferase family 2 protein [Desulfovibrionaceae bacterium]|nr:glycosyltransferase family 2 protein [Desulfovibrionaceae bacterium]
MKSDQILLFIPVYNCEKQIARVLEQLNNDVMKYIKRVIIVNNKSIDRSEQVIKEYLERHMEIPAILVRNDENYGLGGSHKVAFKYALENKFDYIIVLHGDDQGNISDFLPIIKNGIHKNFDCCLGSRFMKGSQSKGYSFLRKFGNYVFNIFFSIVSRKYITDLGSGLNLYKVSSLKNEYYIKFPDTLYFNDCMILAQCYYKQKIKFVPISWREEDQVSNNKLMKFALSLIQLCIRYLANPKKFVEREMRKKIISRYTYSIIFSNCD